MTKVVKIRKGLDIHLKGKAERVKRTIALSDEIGLSPESFPGLKPKVVVREGDRVKAGDALFVDKMCPDVRFASPVSGTVTAVVRGERRKVTLTHDQQTAVDAITGGKGVFLLHGVTGSGKTQVYIQLIHCSLNNPKSKRAVDGPVFAISAPEKYIILPDRLFSRRLQCPALSWRNPCISRAPENILSVVGYHQGFEWGLFYTSVLPSRKTTCYFKLLPSKAME